MEFGEGNAFETAFGSVKLWVLNKEGKISLKTLPHAFLAGINGWNWQKKDRGNITVYFDTETPMVTSPFRTDLQSAIVSKDMKRPKKKKLEQMHVRLFQP